MYTSIYIVCNQMDKSCLYEDFLNKYETTLSSDTFNKALIYMYLFQTKNECSIAMYTAIIYCHIILYTTKYLFTKCMHFTYYH